MIRPGPDRVPRSTKSDALRARAAVADYQNTSQPRARCAPGSGARYSRRRSHRRLQKSAGDETQGTRARRSVSLCRRTRTDRRRAARPLVSRLRVCGASPTRSDEPRVVGSSRRASRARLTSLHPRPGAWTPTARIVLVVGSAPIAHSPRAQNPAAAKSNHSPASSPGNEIVVRRIRMPPAIDSTYSVSSRRADNQRPPVYPPADVNSTLRST